MRHGEHVRAEATATIRFMAAVPQFTVPDVVSTAQYYRDVLGFQIAGYWDGEHVSLTTDPPPVFAIVSRDDVQMFFSRADQPFRESPRATEPDSCMPEARSAEALSVVEGEGARIERPDADSATD